MVLYMLNNPVGVDKLLSSDKGRWRSGAKGARRARRGGCLDDVDDVDDVDDGDQIDMEIVIHTQLSSTDSFIPL